MCSQKEEKVGDSISGVGVTKLPSARGLQSKRDVALLEEPEHLNWLNHSQRWSTEFEHVVGIMHTNYVDYMRRGAGTPPLRSCARR